MKTKKEEVRVILNSLNEQLGTTLSLESRNGYYVIEKVLPSTGAETLASGLSIREALLWARGFQRASWMLNA